MAVDNIARGMAAKALENQGGGGGTAKDEKVYTLEEDVAMFTVPASDFDPAVYPAIQIALDVPTDCTSLEIGQTRRGQNCKRSLTVAASKAYHVILVGTDNLNRSIPLAIGLGQSNTEMKWYEVYWYGYNSGYSEGYYLKVDDATPFPAGATIRVRSL